MRGAHVVLAIALIALLSACGGTSLKAAGEECVAASECGAGLQCDFGSTPPVCSEESTLPGPPVDADPNAPDAGPPPPDAPPGTPDAPPLPPDARVDAEPPPDAELAVDAEPV